MGVPFGYHSFIDRDFPWVINHPAIWVNYNDLTATSLEIMVRLREIIPKWPNNSG